MRRPHALVFFVAIGAGACQLLVGDDDHHLRDDEGDAAALGDGSDRATDGTSPVTDGTVTDGSSAKDAGPDANPWRVIVVANKRTLPGEIQTLRLNANGLDYVYWIETTGADAGTVMRVVDLAMLGTPDLLTNAANPRGLRFEPGSGVFFTDDTRPVAHLFRVGVSPGLPQVDYSSDPAGSGYGEMGINSPYGFMEAVAPDDASTSLRRVIVDSPGGADCITATSAQATTFPAIAVDQAYVFFADSTTGHIMRVTHGCGQTALVYSANQHAIAITVDGTRVFWTTADGHARVADRSLSPVITTYDASLVAPTSITQYNGKAYVADEATGIVYEMTATSDPTIVATGQGGPFAIVSGFDNKIYWTNRTTGEIVSARPADASPD